MDIAILGLVSNSFFLLQRFLISGIAKSRMVLNPESKANADRQEYFFSQKLTNEKEVVTRRIIMI